MGSGKFGVQKTARPEATNGDAVESQRGTGGRSGRGGTGLGGCCGRDGGGCEPGNRGSGAGSCGGMIWAEAGPAALRASTSAATKPSAGLICSRYVGSGESASVHPKRPLGGRPDCYLIPTTIESGPTRCST